MTTRTPHAQEYMTRSTLNGLCVRADRELERQIAKWGHQDHSIGDWWLIVSEEFGELAKSALEGNGANVFNEAAQVIACVARFVEKACCGEPARLTSNGWAEQPALLAPAPPAPEAITITDAMIERGAKAARGLELQIDRNDEAAANDWDDLPDDGKTPYREQAFTVLHAALAPGAAADAGDGE